MRNQLAFLQRAVCVVVASSFILVSGCATTTEPKTKAASEKVEQAASTAGMHRVPLLLTGQNSALVEMTLNGKEIILLLDTGAQGTVIDIAVARSLGVKMSSTTSYGRGVGAGVVAARQGEVVTLTMNGFDAKVSPTLQDFSSMTNNWLRRGGRPIIGLLGYDVLRAYGAIIDLNEGAMYLRKRT
jgi:Aspartyl protease